MAAQDLATTTTKKVLSTQEIADRFNELAQQEKWFDIQDEFFADNVKSIDPADSPYFGYAEGKADVRKKGEDFVSRIEAVHSLSTSEPVVSANHFAVIRQKDITVRPHGRIQINQIMLYEVRDGQIISEQFFY
ncbi:SnoaL-like domain-containing protein [Chitinophaga sp. 22620]|uniref:SnoaL-like domain-containing protein n=1 Tax=Chitinophaga sp. 22620 TaxID=3453952 RepID=UPI003F87D957